MILSHSQVELYNTCPHKYFLMKIEKWSPNKTYSALLFGTAIDAALNYILRRKKHSHLIHKDTSYSIFKKYMSNWSGHNELVYFKNEAPNTDEFNELDDVSKQWAVWNNLLDIGRVMIDTYIDDVLPQLGTILTIQTRRTIKNEAGDSFVLITDFKSKLSDGREVTFDNKTSSDIKKYYGPSSVQKSLQLATYTEYEPNRLAGYIALSKKRINGKIDYIIRIDEIDESKATEAFDRIDNTYRAIKRKEFEKNEKSCFSFGRKCEMWDICKYGKTAGYNRRT